MHKHPPHDKRAARPRLPPLPENLPPAAAFLFGMRLALLDGVGAGIVGHEDERDDRLGLGL